MKYTVMSAGSITDLAELVELSAKQGWEPQGGVSVIWAAGQLYNIRYYQAMVKK